ALHRNFLHARPDKAGAPDPDAVADRLAAVLHEIEQALSRIDDDGAGLLGAGIFDDLPVEARIGRATPPVEPLGRLAARLPPCGRSRLVAGGIVRRGAHAAAAEQEFEQAAAVVPLRLPIGPSLGGLPGWGRPRQIDRIRL